MERVTGIGGVFFKCEDPKGLLGWYKAHLGIQSDEDECATFEWRQGADPDKKGHTVLGLFKQDTDYFKPSTKGHMVNFRVDDLDAMLDQLRAAGAEVDDKIEDGEFGRFGWAMDPEGNRIELWEPPKDGPLAG